MNQHVATKNTVLLNIMQQNALTYRQTSKIIGRSTGWISAAVNGQVEIKSSDFDDILSKLKVKKDPKKFASFVAAAVRKSKPQPLNFDGAILRYLRGKAGNSLREVSIATDLSISYLSELEIGRKKVPVKTRNNLLKFYGCSPGSYKNYCGNDKRAERVPARYKLEILLNSSNEEVSKKVFDFAKQLIEMKQK